ncbi:MAG: hypothetical protein KGL63_05860 [Betaproteobacteria bacterium]|nr:hypothetical protein [Betaproteobacteria bacterium]
MLLARAALGQTYPAPKFNALGINASAPSTAGTINVSNGYEINGSLLSASNLSNGVTGSGAVALAGAPTFTGTLNGAAANFSGNISAPSVEGNSTGLLFTTLNTTTNGMFQIKDPGATYQPSSSALLNLSFGSGNAYTFGGTVNVNWNLGGGKFNVYGTAQLGSLGVGTGTLTSGWINSLNGYQVNGSQIAAANLADGTTGSGPIALSSSPTITTPTLSGTTTAGQITATTSNSTLTLAPATPIYEYNWPISGSPSSYADFVISQTNGGSHTSYDNSAFAINSAPVGAGDNLPAHYDSGETISQIKQNWITSSTLGGMNVLNLIGRQGYDDIDGITEDIGVQHGYAAGIEGHTESFVSGTAGVSQQMDYQLGEIETGTTGTANASGLNLEMLAGTGNSAINISAASGSGWTDLLSGYANNAGQLVFNINAAGQTKITSTASAGATLTLSQGNDANGTSLLIVGNGATTPNKTIQVQNGSLQVVNSADSLAIMSLDDSGNMGLHGVVSPGAGVVGNSAGSPYASNTTVGSYLSNSTSGTSLTSGSASNATSESLPAGIWDVQCTATFAPAASTPITQILVGINTTSAAFPAGNTGGFVNMQEPSSDTGYGQSVMSPTVREDLTSTSTVYCVVQAGFSVSTATVSGFIRATRVQ